MTEKKNRPVNVPAEIYASIQEYSDETGVRITAVVREALETWLLTSGVARLEALRKTRMSNVISFPSPVAQDLVN